MTHRTKMRYWKLTWNVAGVDRVHVLEHNDPHAILSTMDGLIRKQPQLEDLKRKLVGYVEIAKEEYDQILEAIRREPLAV